jgi:hypothetical protein
MLWSVKYSCILVHSQKHLQYNEAGFILQEITAMLWSVLLQPCAASSTYDPSWTMSHGALGPLNVRQECWGPCTDLTVCSHCAILMYQPALKASWAPSNCYIDRQQHLKADTVVLCLQPAHLHTTSTPDELMASRTCIPCLLSPDFKLCALIAAFSSSHALFPRQLDTRVQQPSQEAWLCLTPCVARHTSL